MELLREIPGYLLETEALTREIFKVVLSYIQGARISFRITA